VGGEGKGAAGGKGEEVTQTLYAHINKRNFKKALKYKWKKKG
jgi:hypothetical protein